MDIKYDMLTILGPTAGGKTSLAAKMAFILDGEIISADSRQVYRGMDLGTGKDLEDYIVEGKQIPYHLIDIVDAGYKYNVYEYQKDFLKVYVELQKREKYPVLCGGSGMYLEAVLKGYKLVPVPANENLRNELEEKDTRELTAILKSFKKLHNTSDIDSRKRLIRAIEIEMYYDESKDIDDYFPKINSLIVGVKYDRNSRRKRISERLKQRLDDGMIDEVKRIIETGVSPEILIYYGLEYKYLTQYILGKITYDEMFKQLETAIHQFAKRQMTWFRGMERRGFKIHWLDGFASMNEKTERIVELLQSVD
ncbi:MAG TPA: tRNA (adenosine(37)-N6)-dimethylallyltransferase MiaA [Bacteroidales bacterium]|nr:tRNA (adenosine(37)-N6)-dimethylallyltransferase MiaA [Bacteroidales bacterium]